MRLWNPMAAGPIEKPDGHARELAPSAISREDILAARLRVTRVLPYQRSSTPFLGNLTLAVVSGLLMVFAFPDWNLGSLAWIAVAPLIMACVREPGIFRSFLLGTVTGTVFYAGSSYWVTYSIHNYGGVSSWLSWVLGIAMALILGAFTGVFAAVLSRSIARLGGWAILSAAVIWPACEWLRLKATGMGWNALGYSQAFELPVIQSARLGGVYLTSALLVSVSAALVFGLVYVEKRRGFVVFTIVGAIAILNLVYGLKARPAGRETGNTTVAVLQPNLPIAGDWDDPAYVSRAVDRLEQQSEDLIAQAEKGQTRVTPLPDPAAAKDNPPPSDPARSDPGATRTTDAPGAASYHPNLVIWPESPLPLEYDRDQQFREDLAEFAERDRVGVLLNTWESPDGRGLRNSAVAISESGGKICEYDKIALLPYGEYVPGKNWIPLMNRVSAIVGDVTPGSTPSLCDIAGARVGAFICFEATRPEIARQLRRGGATCLVQLSDEAWFGPSSAAKQMLAETIFRAVENNVVAIRATNSGQSARISQDGSTDGVTPIFESAGRIWKIKTRDEAVNDTLTFYTRRGDVFAVACAVCSLLIFVGALIPRRGEERNRNDRRN